MSEVFRVQDSDGRGPWKPGFSSQWMDLNIGNRATLLPWPNEFGLGLLRRVKPHQSVGCGCVNLEQLWKWFTRPEMDRLHIHGYHLVKLDADEILAQSNIQCVFVRNKPLNLDLEVLE